MGMPASFLTREQIKNTYGYIEDFLKPDENVQKYHGSLDVYKRQAYEYSMAYNGSFAFAFNQIF